MKKKDHCTWFPEKWLGKDISACCKLHDDNCHTHLFYDCLKNKVGRFWAGFITGGGGVGCWVKYPSKMWKRLF